MQHLSEDALERYAMQSAPNSESGPLEEHLLVCPDCLNRLETEIQFVAAMRRAAAKIQEEEAREVGLTERTLAAGHLVH